MVYNTIVIKSYIMMDILKRPKITQNKDFEKPKIIYFGYFSLCWDLAQINNSC